MIRTSTPIFACVLTGLAVTAAPLPAVAQDKPTCSVPDGVEFHRQKNYGKAFECWDAHARRGSSAAQFNIARMYILGEGVPRNNIEAYKWLTIADRSGRPEARAALERIRKTLTPEQLEDARNRVQRFYTSGRR